MEGLQNKKSQLLGIGFMIILMIIAISYVLKDESITNVINTIHTVKPIYIIVGIILMLGYISCEGINIWIILKALNKKATLKDCLGFAFVGFYFSSITPSSSGGQPAQVYFMKRKGISIMSSSLCLMIILFAHQIVIVAYAALALFMRPDFTIAHKAGFHILIAFGIISNAAIIIGILLLIFYPKIVSKIINAFGKLFYRIDIIKNKDKMKNKIEASMEEYSTGAKYMKENPRVIVSVTLVTVIQVTLMFLVPYIIYIAFGLEKFGPLELVLTQAVLNIAVSSLPLPGSVGASESIFVDIFKTFFGKFVIPGMLLTRIANFYAVLVISGIVSLKVYMEKKK